MGARGRRIKTLIYRGHLQSHNKQHRALSAQFRATRISTFRIPTVCVCVCFRSGRSEASVDGHNDESWTDTLATHVNTVELEKQQKHDLGRTIHDNVQSVIAVETIRGSDLEENKFQCLTDGHDDSGLDDEEDHIVVPNPRWPERHSAEIACLIVSSRDIDVD